MSIYSSVYQVPSRVSPHIKEVWEWVNIMCFVSTWFYIVGLQSFPKCSLKWNQKCLSCKIVSAGCWSCMSTPGLHILNRELMGSGELNLVLCGNLEGWYIYIYIYIHLGMIHIVWHKLTQHCTAVILCLKLSVSIGLLPFPAVRSHISLLAFSSS